MVVKGNKKAEMSEEGNIPGKETANSKAQSEIDT